MVVGSLKKFFHKPKSLSDIKDTAYIVVDTNVLLAAYQWKEVTLNEVLDTLNSLSMANRLKIPAQVFEEFIDQRPKKVVEIIQKIDKEMNSKLQRPSSLLSTVPLIEMLDDSNDYLELEKQYFEKYDLYRKKLGTLTKKLGDFLNSDPVLDGMQELLTNSYFKLDLDKVKDIEQEAKQRAQQKLPPLSGGDSSKKENAFGDYYIWRHILSLDNDVIFVTADKKDDWVLKDHHGNILSPRRELVEEFFEVSNGKTFTIVSPKEFVALYKPDMDSTVSKDLLKVNMEITGTVIFFRNLFNKYDPAGVYSLTLLEDEYDSEIADLLEILPKVDSVDMLVIKLYDIIVSYFDEGTAGSIDVYIDMAKEIWKFRKIVLGYTDKQLSFLS
nr:PIN domain-containing protein [Brevibacillus sp. HB1.1]